MSQRRDAGARVGGRSGTAAGHDPAPVFAALGHATRLGLVAALCGGGAMSIAQLTSGTDLTRQAVTKHLLILADAGLARDVRLGRERLWELVPAPLDDARRSLERIGQQWDRALARLKAAVERPYPRGR